MHILQPKHSKLKQDDVKKLLVKYNISLSQLPKISKEDVAVVTLGVETGDVIKIERKIETGVEEYFRVVV
ncbi:DNA-directed RNA polymerase subunit H [Candidatus Pacearchaeota archaeon]|nr:DNA-directed RNA polymerase subunit H [Candidatus Pacearchaeota archaeon]